MRQTLKLVVCAVLWASSAGAQGAGDSLYMSWCSRCHGVDARGTPAASTRLAVPPADLASCAVSSAEPEDLWVDIVSRGGAAYGLSLDMPSYGDAGTAEQIRMVVRYLRSLCRERGWPPGELNFPRPFLVEKAFPENEVVLAAHGLRQRLVYERRVGRRFQLEGELATVIDSLNRPFDGAAVSVKYNLWHSLERLALLSLGLEASLPVGRRTAWELEPYAAAGVERAGFVIQGQIVGIWEEGEGFAGASYRLGAGREVGRFVPMVELGWDVPKGGEDVLTLYPQVWIRLSKLGHVAASVGAAAPATGTDRRAELIAFLLWDFGDGPLTRGW